MSLYNAIINKQNEENESFEKITEDFYKTDINFEYNLEMEAYDCLIEGTSFIERVKLFFRRVVTGLVSWFKKFKRWLIAKLTIRPGNNVEKLLDKGVILKVTLPHVLIHEMDIDDQVVKEDLNDDIKNKSTFSEEYVTNYKRRYDNNVFQSFDDIDNYINSRINKTEEALIALGNGSIGITDFDKRSDDDDDKSFDLSHIDMTKHPLCEYRVYLYPEDFMKYDEIYRTRFNKRIISMTTSVEKRINNLKNILKNVLKSYQSGNNTSINNINVELIIKQVSSKIRGYRFDIGSILNDIAETISNTDKEILGIVADKDKLKFTGTSGQKYYDEKKEEE